MLAPADALPLTVERTVESQPRQRGARSARDRSDVVEFDKCEIGREAYPACDRGAVGIGSVVVAGIWLVLYVITAIHSLAGN